MGKRKSHIGKTVLKEEQRMRAPGPIVLLVLLFVLYLGKLASQYIWHAPVHPLSGWEYLFLGFFFLLAGWLVWITRLKIRVNRKGIRFRLAPFQSRMKKIKWEDIEHCEFVDTPLHAKLSGLGGHHLAFGEKLYSLCGRTGMYLETKQGDRIFLGSRRLFQLRDKIKPFLSDNPGIQHDRA